MLSTAPAPATPDTRPRAAWRTTYAVVLAGLGWYSTAIAWQAQLVSYPLFRSVGRQEFADYHLDYNGSILAVVVIPGFVMFVAGIAFVWARPRGVERSPAVVVSVTSAVALLVTVLWAIPRHDELDRAGPSAGTIDSLLDANLVRSVALMIATLVLTWIVVRLLRRPATAA